MTKKTGRRESNRFFRGFLFLAIYQVKKAPFLVGLMGSTSKESFKLLDIDGNSRAFRIAWRTFGSPLYEKRTQKYIDNKFRRRFSVQLIRGKKLCLDEIVDALRRWGADDVAERIIVAVNEEATDEIKRSDLMKAEFYHHRLSGRARFSSRKMREAVKQIFDCKTPIHPFEKGGCLEQTAEVKKVQSERSLPRQTNNHLVRHRLLILAGDEAAKPKPKEGLIHDLIRQYAGGDKSRISRIVIEVARDLQEMSGKDSPEKRKEEAAKLENHHKVAARLAERLVDSDGNPLRRLDGKPVISASLIRKARIADDLGWKCPYTFADIEDPQLVSGIFDKDHIIPRSLRLSDALEAQVITRKEINKWKDNRTALQFVREFGGQPVRGISNLHIVTENQFRSFVENLWPKHDPFRRAKAGGDKPSDDEKRCWRRKQLLLTERWEQKDFLPGDLTQTSYLITLARQRFEKFFERLEVPVVTIPGAVTSIFRDRAWSLLRLMQHANPAIATKIAEGRVAIEKGEDFNLKKEIRDITHLHHAVDAVALVLIGYIIVPPAHSSINGRLAFLLRKGNVGRNGKTGDEISELQKLCGELRFPKFFKLGPEGRIMIDRLPEQLKTQISQRLSEKRIVQHIPASMNGLRAELNIWRVVEVKDGVATLRQSLRDANQNRSKPKTVSEKVSKLVGVFPTAKGKLADLKGALVVSDNFGVALIDKPVVIPFFKVYPTIRNLRDQNGGKPFSVLRNGHLFSVQRGKNAGVWRVLSVSNKSAGVKIKFGPPDLVRRIEKPINYREALLKSLVRDGLEIVSKTLIGLSSCPTTSSASMPRNAR